MKHDPFVVPAGRRVRLANYDPGYTGQFASKEAATSKLKKDIDRLARYQEILYAERTRSVLIVLQAMDTAGKDGTIRHVMTGLSPQGTQVHSFKAPSQEELSHDFLWRSASALPARGEIGIFNRSYYEEVLVVRVHPEFLDAQQLPPAAKTKKVWKHRFDSINNFEKHLVANGTVVLKFFLHLSRGEQKRRLFDRINTPSKQWKFSTGDLKERARWTDYMRAYEDAISHTNTEHAPWHIVPADNKWFTRAVVGDIVAEKLKSMKLRFPTLDDDAKRQLVSARRALTVESARR